jgi:hypothetical protein
MAGVHTRMHTNIHKILIGMQELAAAGVATEFGGASYAAPGSPMAWDTSPATAGDVASGLPLRLRWPRTSALDSRGAALGSGGSLAAGDSDTELSRGDDTPNSPAARGHARRGSIDSSRVRFSRAGAAPCLLRQSWALALVWRQGSWAIHLFGPIDS